MFRRFIWPLIAALFFLFLSYEQSYACTCEYKGEFIEYSKEQTVIRGKVDSYGSSLNHGQILYGTMTVSVIDIVQGSFSHSNIEFIGDPGHLCLTYIDSDSYPIGSEHLFTVLNKYQKQGLGGCGEVSVLIVDDKVEGRKYNESKDKLVSYSVNYDRFIEAMTKPKPLNENKPLTKSKPWWKFW